MLHALLATKKTEFQFFRIPDGHKVPSEVAALDIQIEMNCPSVQKEGSFHTHSRVTSHESRLTSHESRVTSHDSVMSESVPLWPVPTPTRPSPTSRLRPLITPLSNRILVAICVRMAPLSVTVSTSLACRCRLPACVCATRPLQRSPWLSTVRSRRSLPPQWLSPVELVLGVRKGRSWRERRFFPISSLS